MPLPLILAFLLGQAPSSGSAFVQSSISSNGKMEVRTAARKMTAVGKPDIWLVSTVHVARPDYYKALQALLDRQKLVLFEGVDNEEKEEANLDERSTVAEDDLYGGLAKALGLQSQLDGIDYDRPNWWNCDLSIVDLDRLNKKLGKGKPNGYDRVKALLDPTTKESKEAMKIFSEVTPGVAEAVKIIFIRMGETEERSSDPVYDAIVLKARNERVLDSLSDIIKTPPTPASVGAFYGAGHMSEIQKTLMERYGYGPAETRWYLAMDADRKKLDKGGQKLVDLFEKSLKPAAPVKKG